MELEILSMHQGEFKDDTNVERQFSNAWVLPNEHHKDSHDKGRKPQKINAAWDLIRSINPDDLPGVYEVEYSIGNGGKAVLVAAKAKNGKKVAA